MGAPENLVEIITGYFSFTQQLPLLQSSWYCLVYLTFYEFLLTRFAETGKALVSSVDKIIFVGSPGVGRMVRYYGQLIILFSVALKHRKSFWINVVVLHID